MEIERLQRARPLSLDLDLSGIGEYICQNSEGSFTCVDKDKFSGYSKYTYRSSSAEVLGVYEGEFKNGKRSGSGEYSWENGDYYSGTWLDDKFNGTGYLKKSDYKNCNLMLIAAYNQASMPVLSKR